MDINCGENKKKNRNKRIKERKRVEKKERKKKIGVWVHSCEGYMEESEAFGLFGQLYVSKQSER